MNGKNIWPIKLVRKFDGTSQSAHCFGTYRNNMLLHRLTHLVKLDIPDDNLHYWALFCYKLQVTIHT